MKAHRQNLNPRNQAVWCGGLQRLAPPHTQLIARVVELGLLWALFTSLLRDRQKHALKIIAYQLWSSSKNHWVAWPFLGLVIIWEKWMAWKRAFKLLTLCNCEFQGCSTERPILQSVLRKVGLRFLNIDPSFLFCVDMASVSHWAVLMLLCWYLQGCRATCHWRSKWKIGKEENTGANLRQVH